MPTTTLRRALALLAATACAVLGFGASAAADPLVAPRPPAKAELVLTIAADPGYVAALDGASPEARVAQVTLTCGPDGGTHPSPGKACDSLRAVDGSFERLPSIPDVFCPAVWLPVKVTATGHWGDRKVSYSEKFGNSCEAGVGTDGVFFF